MTRPGRPKGLPKTGGRVAGTPNKTGRSVKAIYEDVFMELQLTEEHSLSAWAKENRTEYYKLATKLIPNVVGNDPENPLPAPSADLLTAALAILSAEQLEQLLGSVSQSPTSAEDTTHY